MTYIQQLLSNKIFIVSILSWAIAQFIKIILDLITAGSVDWRLMFSSGGMPSSHSAFVCALAAMEGFCRGFDSDVFAIAFVLAAVVMYDAAGVRRAAGHQAEIINRLIESQNINIDKRLKELIGHTPTQVVTGAALGVAVAFISSIVIK